jgi:GrpB-like predicted nucleotidyltransferase (UPF0157 family)
VGSLDLKASRFRIHAHVIASSADERDELIWFRETLRGDAGLRRAYEQRKQMILAAGIRDSIAYCKAKGEFVTAALQQREPKSASD